MVKVILSLFDHSGIMVEPWAEAGYECWIVDKEHPDGINKDGNIVRVKADLQKPWLPPKEIIDRITFMFAFPPCDHLAVSGSRWFKGKGLRKLSESIAMFGTAAELLDKLNVPGFIENPVSTISTYWRNPDYTFHPYFFTGYNIDDNYMKLTCLWINGDFKVPEHFIKYGLANPDDRIHKCPPGADRKRLRSLTPKGFAMAIFNANGRI